MLAVFFVFGIAPLLLLSIVNYLNGVRTVEDLLREEVGYRATRMARDVREVLRDREADLAGLARARSLRDYVRAARPETTARKSLRRAPPAADVPVAIPEDLRADITAFFRNTHNYYATLTCLRAEGEPLFRVERAKPSAGGGAAEVRFQTKDFVMSGVRPDARVWSTPNPTLLRSPVTRESFGAVLRYTIPVFIAEVSGADERHGALVADLDLSVLFEEAKESAAALAAPAGRGGATALSTSAAPARLVVVLDRAGNIIHHTSDALKYQQVATAMPFFKPIAERMVAGASGTDFYHNSDDDWWLASYRPIPDLGLSVAAAGNYSGAVAGLQRAGWISIVLSVLAALAATGLLILVIRRTARRIERVAAGAAAIAGGDLDQRIDVRASDETRLLAESFNRMTDRLREHIAREAETRQFESFMRLSAMLTHDLKNSITSLSMLVSNMERQFHREEFRADAVWSLREATDKLRRIVARLSEPVKSLSGEYRRDAKSTDLVPIIKRVLAATAEPSAPLYQIEAQLPETLVETIEPERIENVIENLVINALEAMGARGGRLTVEAGKDEAGRTFFSVADTGVGMSEEFLRTKLFHAFATTKSKGIGLGLFTCREIVEAHGGRLDVESKPGVGTRFRVVLPSSVFTSRDRQEQMRKKASASGRHER